MRESRFMDGQSMAVLRQAKGEKCFRSTAWRTVSAHQAIGFGDVQLFELAARFGFVAAKQPCLSSG